MLRYHKSYEPFGLALHSIYYLTYTYKLTGDRPGTLSVSNIWWLHTTKSFCLPFVHCVSSSTSKSVRALTKSASLDDVEMLTIQTWWNIWSSHSSDWWQSIFVGWGSTKLLSSTQQWWEKETHISSTNLQYYLW